MKEMDIRKHWLSSRSQRTATSSQNIRLGRSYTKPHHYRSYDHGSTNSVWKVLWKKLKMRRTDKRKVFSCHGEVEGVYDPDTYSMNFDQGTGWMEPDNLPRSFSARYADPSRLLPPKDLLA